VLVNTSAVLGQALWAKDHLVPDWMRPNVYAVAAVCVLFALTVESIAVYLAYEAHAAQMEGQAYGTLRLASYGVALVAGALNYAHFAGAPDYTPNPLAVTFGLLSSMSPWLWAIRSRSMHRVVLTEKGLIDPRSVRFTLAQRLLYPVATFGAYRLAVWNGVNNPAQARADFTAMKAPVLCPPVPDLSDIEQAEDQPKQASDDAADERSPRLTPATQKIIRARQRRPVATKTEIAAKTGLSLATVRRQWALTAPPVPATAPTNGHAFEIAPDDDEVTQ
jgi:hypothetical protein